MSRPILRSLQVGLPADHGREGASNPLEKPWRSGFFKGLVEGPVRLGRTNLEGDGQADLKNHGGPDKAVCGYSADHYGDWRAELGIDDFPFGAFGENFTIEGLKEEDVCIGDSWRVGSAVVQVSQPRQPCWKLARRWGMKDLPARVVESGRTGWYFRVLQAGLVEAGQEMRLVERPYPEWSVDRANGIFVLGREGEEGIAGLARVDLLAESWRGPLEQAAGL